MTPVPLGSWEAGRSNLALLQAIQATLPAAQVAHATARFLCEVPLVLCIALVAWGVLVRRRYVLGIEAAVASALVIGFESIIARVAPQPRPFVFGWAAVPIEHAANNALPSTHVALAVVAAGTFLFAARHRDAVVCLLAALAMMWARIATGLHWPLDMLAAVVVATAAVTAVHRIAQRLNSYLIRSND